MTEPEAPAAAGVGVVVHAMSGMFTVQTEEGTLLCRPRGRLRGRSAGAWRDVRDAERTDAALLADPEEEDGEEGLDWGVAEAVPEPDGGRERRRGGRAGRVGAGSERSGRGGRGRVQPEPATAEEGEPALLAGDRVRCSRLPDGEGAIDEVLPRTSVLLRPPVANADHVVVVCAWAAPPFSPAFADRVLLEAALRGCGASLVCNKADLLSAEERTAADAALAPYRAAGYTALLVSATAGEGLVELRAAMAGRLTVVAGPSGSGKSRLLAALMPARPRRSAAVSARVGRGRHTTRSVELLPLPEGGWVADTPGFSRLDLQEAEPEDLPYLYPEFRPYLDLCRYRGCGHGGEPECAVRAAVEAGAVDAGRYARYLQLVTEMRARRRGRP